MFGLLGGGSRRAFGLGRGLWVLSARRAQVFPGDRRFLRGRYVLRIFRDRRT